MSKRNKKIILLLLSLSPLILFAQSKSEYIQIVNKFEQWKTLQFKNGNFATEKNCNTDTMLKEGPEMGIPNDIHISFTDFNEDNKLDAIVTFTPDQCDGGNALMNAQIRVLILSGPRDYAADDSYIDKIESELKKGWLIIESGFGSTLYGSYYEYKDSDGRCCPSIKKPFSIDFKTKKLTFDE